MVKVMKFALVCLAVVGLVGVAVPVFAQEKAEPQVTSVSGEVVSVDLVKSEVVVKQIKDVVASTYENTTFAVASEMKIQKGDVTLKLSDLKAGDKVTVKYTTDVLGKKKVESIAVEIKEVAPVK
jgi:ABC-type Fe3+-hydroxamate transport system substrate-binding protein